MELQQNKINDEEGINPEKISYGVKPRSLSETEPDIIMNYMVQQKLHRAPRYFDPPECSLFSSNEPGKDNVEDEKCKKRKKRKRCYNCGNIGHEGKRCKKRKCFICSQKGHLIIDCPLKNVEVDSPSRLCLKCGSTGHDMFSCSNDYDSEDLKGIKCYICKEFGHLCCVNNTMEGTSEASCFHCGQSGHFGSECIKLKEVASDLQLCSKCGQSGHFPNPCVKHLEGGKAKGKKPRKRRGWKKRNSVPVMNAYQYQANMAGHWYRPPIVPCYGRPGSHVWLSPAAAAARGIINDQNGGLPSHQSSNNQVGTQDSFRPMTQFPHLIRNRQQGDRTPQQPLNHQIGIQISQTETQQVPHNSFYPMQLPHLICNSLRGTQVPEQPRNYQTENPIPRPETIITQLPRQQPLYKQSGILLDQHTKAAIPPQNSNNPTGIQDSAS